MRPHASPLGLLIVTAITIFIAEGFSALLFHVVPALFGSLAPQRKGLLDVLLLMSAVTPVLYWTLFRPLRMESATRVPAGGVLQQTQDALRLLAQQQSQDGL